LKAVSESFNTGTLLDVPSDLNQFKERVLDKVTPHVEWHCETFRELLDLVLEYLGDIESQFNSLFGAYIFDLIPISNVDHDGPALEES
jgi:hypothetical protein